MLQDAIDYVSAVLPRADPQKPITQIANAVVVRSGSLISVIGDPHRWVLALIRFIGKTSAAAAVTNADATLFGRFGATLNVSKDGKALKLRTYGMSAAFAAKIEKPKRRLLVDVSEAQKAAPAHGRKSARIDKSAVLEVMSS